MNKTLLPDKIKSPHNVIVIAPSQWLIDRFQNTALAKKISRTKVIPNIIYVPEIAPTIKRVPAITTEFKLLFAAVNPEAPTKGLDLLIQAVTNFAAQNPRVRINLDIVGKGVVVNSELRNLSFTVHGIQKSSSMEAFFKKVDLVVVPSRIDNSPSIISEAQLNGVLVLGTNVGGIPELITDSISGFLCDPNVESIEAGLNRAFTTVQKSELVDFAFKQATKRHDRANIVREHIEAYTRLSRNA
jgi:glycosyltransferase involved in cell wall biosynthesis